jgi:hypothetical protein
MPSTYSASLRFELQASGENLNAWGTRLNTALSRVDKAIAGRSAIVLAGVAYTLSTSNTLDDESRSAILDLSGVGNCNVVIPSVPKLYLVRNGSSGDAVVTTGAGATATVVAGDVAMVMCDGAGVAPLMLAGLDLRAVSSAALPGQVGNSGKLLTTNGTTPSWVTPTVSYLSNYASDQAAKRTEILATALAASIAVAIAL